MDQYELKSILQEALEEEVPSSQINLWPDVRDDLVAGKQKLNQQGEIMNTVKSKRRLRIAGAGLIVITLLAAGLLTPQGRSFAQSVLQLFTPAESESFPVDSPPDAGLDTDPAAPTAEAPAPLVSAAEAEAQAGFEVLELPETPAGFEYQGARMYGNAVYLEYGAENFGGSLMIRQSLEGYNQSEWEQVPAGEIVPVKIGDLDGEFARGTFVVYAGETEATWNPEAAMLRLRWVQDDVWFEMTKMGNVEPIEYLDRDGMIELAESLTATP
jgi:hypothetical protein